jgi:LmbE family N-acetylglucosaminyl deacetylase
VLHFKFGNLDHAPVVLCLGAHCDDIEIGCGGTLVRWAREYPACQFVWACFAGEPDREQESRAAASRLLETRSPGELRFFDFRGSYFPTQFELIKDAFEDLKRTVRPDIVLTHHLHDRHQDHKLIADLTWNTFRSHLVLEYEIPKYEGDLGQPNVFVPLAAADLEHKIRCLIDCFPSQRTRAWFTEDTFRAVARLRGVECASPSGFAEAFHGRKLSL